MKKAGRDNPEPAFKWYEPVLKIDLTNGGTFTSIRLYIHFLTKGPAAMGTFDQDCSFAACSTHRAILQS